MNISNIRSNNKFTRKVRKPDTFLLSGDSNPYITRGFCILCIVIYVLDMLTGYSLTTLGIKDNSLIIDSGDIYRLFTCTLLHGGVMHLVSNLIFIKIYGEQSEYYYGHLKMAIIIVAAGFSGSLCSLAFTEARSVGASGIAFGLLGAILAVRYVMPCAERKKVTKNCIYLIVVNLVLGVLSGGVDNAAHIGGFLGGLAIGYGMSARKETERDKVKKVGLVAYFILNMFFMISAYTDILPHYSIWAILKNLIGI